MARAAVVAPIWYTLARDLGATESAKIANVTRWTSEPPPSSPHHYCSERTSSWLKAFERIPHLASQQVCGFASGLGVLAARHQVAHYLAGATDFRCCLAAGPVRACGSPVLFVALLAEI